MRKCDICGPTENKFVRASRVCQKCVVARAKKRQQDSQAYPPGCYNPRDWLGDKIFI